MTFFPLTVEKEEGEEDPDKAEASDEAKAAEEAPVKTTQSELDGSLPIRQVPGQPLTPEVQGQQLSVFNSGETEVAQAPITVTDPKQARLLQPQTNTSINPPDSINQVETLADEGVNPWMILGVTFFGGGLCFATMRSILGVHAEA